jgi:hypothetical protein
MNQSINHSIIQSIVNQSNCECRLNGSAAYCTCMYARLKIYIAYSSMLLLYCKTATNLKVLPRACVTRLYTVDFKKKLELAY